MVNNLTLAIFWVVMLTLLIVIVKKSISMIFELWKTEESVDSVEEYIFYRSFILFLFREDTTKIDDFIFINKIENQPFVEDVVPIDEYLFFIRCASTSEINISSFDDVRKSIKVKHLLLELLEGNAVWRMDKTKSRLLYLLFEEISFRGVEKDLRK